MNIKKTLATMAATTFIATGAWAQDIAVIGGSINDGFWNILKKGVEDAGLMVEANGGSVNYLLVPNYDNFGPDLVTLIEQAVAQGVDGIAIPVWVPESQMPALLAAREKGIVITLYNAGADKMEELGALNYFGSDEYVAGVAGGKYLAEKGAMKILCHIQIPGAINLESRCQGVVDGAKEAGSETYVVRMPANLDQDMVGTSEALKAELIGDDSIDGIITLAAWASDAAANAIEQLGANDRVMLGTFDLSSSVLSRIESGKQTMGIDQQPYYQGFLSTATLFAHLKFGTKIVTEPVLTGPAIVDASNIESALAGVALGAR
ncbi:substrate-binding domain-containing protein [Rhodobacteraceae bacterium]|nr:substrate-binding domain-containing protein [Paracoccaceae bacterium]